MSTKHMRMIEELGWDDKTACHELGCTPEEFDRSKNDAGKMLYHSAYILCKKYNEIVKPESPVTVDQLVED